GAVVRVGPPGHRAREQGRGQADHRSDIFSVGAVAYELFSGRPPFTGENPLQILDQLRTVTPPRLSELDPTLPPELSTIVARAIQTEQEQRFAALAAMGRELAAVPRRRSPRRPPTRPRFRWTRASREPRAMTRNRLIAGNRGAGRPHGTPASRR